MRSWSANPIKEPPAGLTRHSLAEHDVLAVAAAAIVADQAAQLPDLSACCVLLPNFHAAGAMAKALTAAAQQATLLLPKLTTLPQWASSVPLQQSCVADSLRQSLLYAALRNRNWVEPASLWSLSADLLNLFDQLTHAQIGLPATYEAFVERLAHAYNAAAGASLQFEARLVHELWYALQQDLGQRVDSQSAYLLRLARLAENAALPLYVVGVSDVSAAEQAFFDAYAQGRTVQIFLGKALSETEPSARGQVLAAAWKQPAAQDSGTPAILPTLLERAQALRVAQPHSPYSGKLHYFAAHSLEQEAAAAALQIRLWLAAGHEKIAVIAQDRLSARRLRALLERVAILVEDETGWTFSTTSASALLMRWLDLIAGDFSYQALLDFLKSPWVLASLDREQRRAAVAELELLIREHNLVAGLRHYADVARSEHKTACLGLLQALLPVAQAWSLRRALRLKEWLELLLDSLRRLDVYDALDADLAGTQLLQNLNQAVLELDGAFETYRFAEFRLWLNQQFESATFLDTAISSSVVFTHLAATRLREFDAALILGSDAAHLPALPAHSVFFNQAVRAQLQLPTAQAALQQTQRDLASLLIRVEHLMVSWQASIQGEANALSPWFALLRACHQAAYHSDMSDVALRRFLAADALSEIAAAPRARPMPSVAGAVPQAISASGYASLMACPYQYFARHALGLNALDEVQLEMEKRDFGTVVHKILQRFHARFPVLPRDVEGEAQAQLALAEISSTAFAPLLRMNYLSHAWQWQWQALQAPYLAWQSAREAQGWQFLAGEQKAEVQFDLGGGLQLRLHGRVDRIDQQHQGRAVIDYKLRAKNTLTAQLANAGEDVQLPVYALLAGEAVVDAAYLSFSAGEVQRVATPQAIQSLAEQVGARLQAMFSALHAGAGLPAQGVASVCAYCEMEGLCRRSYWTKRSVSG